MKIDKVLFSVSEPEEYSSFWNMQSRLFRSMGIEPICLLFGKRSNTDMTEEFGTVIEMPFEPDLPEMIQITWSKFDWPTREPDATWLIGDMDLVPLQRAHFTSKIAGIPDGSFAHLNAGGIGAFAKLGPPRVRRDSGLAGGADLPGHYWVGKGRLFEIFTQGRSFADQVNHITSSMRYGLGPMGGKPPAEAATNPYWHYWCAEENYTSELLWKEMQADRMILYPVYYNNHHNAERIQRDNWDEATRSYRANDHRVSAQKIVDAHCKRPYARQREDLERLINLSGVLTGELPAEPEAAELPELPSAPPPAPRPPAVPPAPKRGISVQKRGIKRTRHIKIRKG